MSNVKVYTTNGGVVYLGTMEKKTITGIKIQEGPVTADVVANLLKAELLGETVQRKIGKGEGLGTRELTRREHLDFTIVVEEMKQAESVAADWVLTKVFDEFRAKKQ